MAAYYEKGARTAADLWRLKTPLLTSEFNFQHRAVREGPIVVGWPTLVFW